jgi:hypothetical protein
MLGERKDALRIDEEFAAWRVKTKALWFDVCVIMICVDVIFGALLWLSWQVGFLNRLRRTCQVRCKGRRAPYNRNGGNNA